MSHESPRRLVRLLCCLWLAHALHAVSAADEVPAPPEFAAVRAFIHEAIERQRVPSVAVGVVREGRLVWAEGFGCADLEHKRPATAHSIYRLASISKPITATGLMRLVEEGLVDLDAPANRYLPGEKLRCYAGPAGSADEMTVRRLANHTSGLPLHYSFFYAGTQPPPMDETIRRYGFAAAPPGTRWEYSNLAFGVLDHVTATVSGTSWRDYMETKLYDPLGMTRTSDRIRPGCEEDAVVQYNRLPGGGFQPVGHYDFDHPGASAVCSTVHDLARFARMHLDGGTLDGVRILSEESVRAMQTVTTRTAGAGRTGSGQDGCGIAWFVSSVAGRRSVAHSGGMPGVSTALRLFPDERAATIVLTNGTERSVTTGVSDRLAAVLFVDNRPIEAPRPNPRGPGSGGPAPAASSSEPEASAARSAGTWQGRLAHADGDIAVRLRIEDSGAVHVQMGTSDEQPLANVAIRADRLHGWFTAEPADLPARPDDTDPVRVELRLDRVGDTLTGVAIAYGPGRFALSHWIELRREKL